MEAGLYTNPIHLRPQRPRVPSSKWGWQSDTPPSCAGGTAQKSSPGYLVNSRFSIWGSCLYCLNTATGSAPLLPREEAHSLGGFYWCLFSYHGFPCKESACNVGDVGSIPALGRSPGEGNGNPSQYSCLENPMDRGAWWATVHGVVKESDMT